MATILAKDKGGGDFKPVPAGTHRAICTLIADMGVQKSERFKPQHKVYIRWELPDETVEWQDRDGNKHKGPMVIGKTYTLSLGEKANLRADLESWRGRMFTKEELKGFDLQNILGKPCQVGVTHKTSGDKTYANVSAVMGLSKGMQKPESSTIPVSYSIDEHDQEVFEKLPNWLQEAIKDRVSDDRTVTVANDTATEEQFDDDIPF